MTGKQFTSVWFREPRKAATPARSREEIVRAAMELLDEEGLTGLSMRKLGAKLSAGATSLYWYVANKDELLELAYDQIWAEMTVPDAHEVGWRDASSSWAYSMRAVMLRHPWSASLLGHVPALGPHALTASDRMRKVFKAAGFRGLDVDYAVAAVTAFVYGMTLPEIAWDVTVGDYDYDAEEMRGLVAKAAADFPDMLESLAMEAYEDPAVVRATAFDFGLVSVLDGLERRLVT
ncbi:TetR/AcrR family transcriptional regulator C-terminal domain-containing protein [Nonomuraea spiralis]|uniref:TetR/AcrR family transcriptional regulator C-terminal domain-containing protein n=1 Tax=Nonomuraea spiralis TaxID=46182 RepID=A0ABV5IL73_9ACTN|nr:TetR/AcrR family transcriptional regulator C-terminal domain-containing protein [Nonomuraea spiralis]GGT36369.1 TetR family transcriptional regulator [Nonomuraea spiralis]